MSKSSSTSSSSSATTPSPSIKPESYSHSPVHYAVVLGDHTTLTRLLSTLPKLTDPTQIHTESDSLNQEKLADKISSLVDRRDVPYRETPLHLAVRLNDLFAAKSLAAAAADVSFTELRWLEPPPGSIMSQVLGNRSHSPPPPPPLRLVQVAPPLASPHCRPPPHA
ncbi:hypothetical protein OIU78_024540 [Salix suchowensis]|nr:hypothetical protein OIU78_024540 [Salix suchowensis]